MALDRELEKLLSSASTTRALVAYYDRVIRRLVTELAAGVSQAQAFRTEALLARLRKILDDIDPKKSKVVSDWIKTNVRKAFVVGDSEATRSLQAALRESPLSVGRKFLPVDAQFTVINEIAINGLVAAMNATMGKARDLIEAKLGTVIRQTQTSLASAARIREATTEGFIRGATRQEIADDIASILLGKRIAPEVRDRLRTHGFNASMFNDFEAVARGQMIKIGKRNFTVRHYSNLVANTQLREAHKVATITRLRQNGVRHVLISKHVQHVPDVCTPFAGRVFYTGEGADPAGFPPLRSTPNGGPPWHPFCRHSLRPYVIALRTDRELETARQASANILDFLGNDSSVVTQQVKELSPAAFKRIAAQGETTGAASN